MIPRDESGDAGALLSPDGLHRYRLWRRWGIGPALLFVGFNPSTADAERDDHTIRRLRGFARREVFDGLEVVNLWTLRTPTPRMVHELSTSGRLGPEADVHLEGAFRRAAMARLGHGCEPFAVACWGGLARDERDRLRVVHVSVMARSLGVRLLCLGTNADGSPRHPLYLRSTTPLEPWKGQGVA